MAYQKAYLLFCGSICSGSTRQGRRQIPVTGSGEDSERAQLVAYEARARATED